jgi:glycoside/pentoside/hexuronide:cation symporter, GPH family
MHKGKQTQTPVSERIPVSRKAAFGFGSMAQCLGSYSIGNLANFVFNIGLGVSPFLVGLAQSIPRLWDAFSDPLMGHFSDNARTRWGRRRPFMLVGAVLMGILFAAIWCLPAGWSEYAYFSWFLGLSLLFYTALTVFMVPWGAMGLEMTRDYHERTRIQAAANLFANIGAIIMPWLFALTQLDIFRDGLQGAKVVGAGVGLVLIISGLIPVFFCRERHFEEVAGQKKISLWHGLKTTCTNKVFMRLMLAVFLAASGFFTIATLSPYITIYYVLGGDTKAASMYVGWGGTSWVLSSILFIGPVTWASTHFGKKRTFLVFLGINLIGHLSKIWCYNPDAPWMVVIPPILIAAGFVALFTLGASMIADICDLDELHTGSRREGSYQAVFGWILKTGMSAALLVGGLLLMMTGFDQELGGMQTSGTIMRMRILEAGLPLCAVAAAIWVAARYPLSEQRVHEIREKLNAKNKGETG